MSSPPSKQDYVNAVASVYSNGNLGTPAGSGLTLFDTATSNATDVAAGIQGGAAAAVTQGFEAAAYETESGDLIITYAGPDFIPGTGPYAAGALNSDANILAGLQ